MLGMQTGIAEIALEKQQAKELAVAIANVARHYQWSPVAEKTKDWILLGVCVGMIYGPRIPKIRERFAKKPVPEVIQEGVAYGSA
jgi:hypothetical protein